MTYLQRSNRHRPGRAVALSIFLACVLALLIVLYLFFGTAIRGITYSISKPFWRAGNTAVAWSAGTLNIFKSTKTLQDENESLRQELNVQSYNDISLKLLETENEELRNTLSLRPSATTTLTTVLATPPQVAYDTLVLDNTSRNIKVGARVFLEKHISLGTITSTDGGTAIATLYSQTKIETDAILQRTGARYTLVGNGGGNLFLQVPRDVDIQNEDMFVLPNEGSLIGIVGHVESEDTETFKKAYILLPTNFERLRFVYVESK